MGSVLCWLCRNVVWRSPLEVGTAQIVGIRLPRGPPPTSFVKPESKRPPAPWHKRYQCRLR